MHTAIDRKKNRRRVRYRVRKKVSGTAVRPRLAVFRSLKHIYAQAIDDQSGKTLAHASTQDEPKGVAGCNVGAAEQVGKLIAEKLTAAGIESVVFDRGGVAYHGRVKALAEAARKSGLKL